MSVVGNVTVRHDLRPGDLGRVVALHAVLYAREHAFDHTFEGYVAETVGQFAVRFRPARDRLWLAEIEDRLVGSIAIVGKDDAAAQLRWFLLDPDVRGVGLGRRLLGDALAFCRSAVYRSVFLWTIHPLTAAARLYEAHGFRKTEAKPVAALWGALLSEERYDLALR
jgi:GNAT superfamily N-acetyltransferase